MGMGKNKNKFLVACSPEERVKYWMLVCFTFHKTTREKRKRERQGMKTKWVKSSLILVALVFVKATERRESPDV
jgi:hypothetical protein